MSEGKRMRAGEAYSGDVLQLAEGEYVVVAGSSDDEEEHIFVFPLSVAYSETGKVTVEGMNAGTQRRILEEKLEVTYIGMFHELAPQFLSALNQLIPQ